MRIREVFSEAGRNIASGTSRTAALAIVLATTVTVLGAAEGESVRQVVRGAYEFRSSGASVVILSADQGINGIACERLVTVAGIETAGAIRPAVPDSLLLTSLPTLPVPLKEATPGFRHVLHAAPEGTDGMLISEQVARTTGRGPGGHLWAVQGALGIAGVYVYPADGRSPQLEYAAVDLVPAGVGLFDECWAEVWPLNAATAQLLRTSLDSSLSPDHEVSLSQLNTTLGSDFDGVRRFDERTTANAALVCLLAGLALGYLSSRLRRLELSSARHAGVSVGAQLLQVAVEATTWAAIAILLSAPTLWYQAARVDDSVQLWLFWVQFRCPLAGASGAILGVLAGAMLNRERHLFRHFKDR
jgi:hypothetical protein